MEYGLDTDFTNADANACFIRVPSVAEFCGLLRSKFAPHVKKGFFCQNRRPLTSGTA